MGIFSQSICQGWSLTDGMIWGSIIHRDALLARTVEGDCFPHAATENRIQRGCEFFGQCRSRDAVLLEYSDFHETFVGESIAYCPDDEGSDALLSDGCVFPQILRNAPEGFLLLAGQ